MQEQPQQTPRLPWQSPLKTRSFSCCMMRLKEEERLMLGWHEKLEKKEQQLLGDRRALQAKLHGTGESTLLLRCQRHQAVLNLPVGLWVKLSII